MKETKMSAKSKIKRTLKDNMTSIVIAGILLVAFLAMLAMTRSYSEPPRTQEDLDETPFERATALYEITEVDILPLKNVTSKDISVKGIMVGDPLSYVVKKLGNPDKRNDFPDNIVNIEYSKSIGLNETGLIVHFKDNEVARISMRPPFNAYLKGKTKIGLTKEETYSLLGKPDDLKHLSVSPGSSLLYRLLEYHSRGIEVTMRRSVQNGLNLVPPS